jgi:hypothetical protein
MARRLSYALIGFGLLPAARGDLTRMGPPGLLGYCPASSGPIPGDRRLRDATALPALKRSSIVPRYYFHVEDGSSIPDDTGCEFDYIDAVKVAAVDFAGSVLRERTFPAIWNGETWELHVTDGPVIGEGRTFCWKAVSVGGHERVPDLALPGLASILDLGEQLRLELPIGSGYFCLLIGTYGMLET